MTDSEGPAISRLHNRLTSTPREIAEATATPHLPALVHDLLYRYTEDICVDRLDAFTFTINQKPWYTTTYLILYFVSANEFAALALDPSRLLHCLVLTAEELHSSGKNTTYIEDLDRREEFIRVVLAALGLRPQGESKIQADDRLISVSSLERKRVTAAAKAAEERAAKIREALAEKAAREAADKMTRE